MILSSGFNYGAIGIFIFIATIFVSCFRVNAGRGPLDDFILRFEPIFYDQHQLRDHHRRFARSTADHHVIRMQFVAYKRVFRLRLERDPWVFADRTEFVNSESTVHYDTSRALTGHVEGERESFVQGVLLGSGLFDGSIRVGEDELFVEPADHYHFTEPTDFHSVVYRLADVRYPETNRTCGPLHERRRRRHQGTRRRRSRLYWTRDLDSLHYTETGSSSSSEPYGVRSVQRTQWPSEEGGGRRGSVAVDRRKSTCLLYLQADHLFYRRLGGEEACIDAMTRHVQRVNAIYRNTDFDQDGRPDNISFLIKRVKVHTRPDDPDYRFAGGGGGHVGVERFLELFSEDDFDAFCLAYMFTYRDFEGGTLGLAWTGDLKNAGGVCEKNGHYRGSLKSLNTGIITLLNYGKHVPPVVSHVTLAHEIGHNFGSPHDPEDDLHCTPGGDYGNYIMFARATSGDKRNNNKFSPCSLRSINAVLNTKARSVKGCFTEPLDAVCGNEVVEGAEECDCGWEEECREPCCFPMRVDPPQDQPPCRLRPAAYCSPSQGPCCSADCRLKYGEMCREDNGCRTSSYCDGKGPLCPPSTKKPNKTVCSEEFVCYNGECTGSICMAYGLESCQCVRGYADPMVRSCELCCKIPGDEPSCKSSFEWNLPPYDVPDLYAKPGAPCDNYNGYCDVHQSCQEIDPSGPLATLRNLLMSSEGVALLKKWVVERWWNALLLFLAATVTVALSVRLWLHRDAKSFLATLLPGQSGDFRFCHVAGSSSTSSFRAVPASRIPLSKGHGPRVSSAPENGWV